VTDRPGDAHRPAPDEFHGAAKAARQAPDLPLSNFDNDFPFCTSRFDVSHRLFGRFKCEDPVQDRAYGARLDQRTDLSQLIAARSHEEKGIVDLMTSGLSPDPQA
jgi:hypothetical protein